MSLGPAREVCLDDNVPVNCPPGALRYGQFSDAWHGSDQLNAFWIWRGDVAPNQLADLELATFQKAFDLCPNARGVIEVACDDFAEVFVNNTSIGQAGSFTDATTSSRDQNTPRSFSLTGALIPGSNTITIPIVGRTGPASFAGDCGSSGCTYRQNPAGVVFQGQLSWD
jgi:hypothetical protein